MNKATTIFTLAEQASAGSSNVIRCPVLTRIDHRSVLLATGQGSEVGGYSRFRAEVRR